MSETLRCKHRQDEKHHPRCFENGIPKEARYTTTPKILLLDIETAPMEVYTWSLRGNDYISPTNIIKDWFVLSWSAKFLFSSQVFSDSVTPQEASNRDDSRMIMGIYQFLNEAQIVITHNGNKFDLPKINSRLLVHGFPPPTHYQTIDTLSVARKYFGFSSNKLDYLNKILGLNLKDDMSFDDWIACVHGNREALSKMEKYNRKDVLNLEDLYVTLRPWIQNHPNVGVYLNTEDSVCKNCGKELKDENWEGTYETNTAVYRAFRCSCGAIGRDKVNLMSKEKKQNLTA